METCPNCGCDLVEEDGISGMSCPECGYNTDNFFEEDDD